MISKNQIKFIQSLGHKKNRNEQGLFVVEGVKMVNELILSNHKIHSIFAKQGWIKSQKISQRIDIMVVSDEELKKISSYSTPNEVLALAYMLNFEDKNLNPVDSSLVLALDSISDPGNLGTIIRIADWFGIKSVFCSKNSVDLYNPKTIQSTMGSIFRVVVKYIDMFDLTQMYFKCNIPVYAAVLDGQNVYEMETLSSGLLIMGSESHGISKELVTEKVKRISIPSFGQAESLNVAISTAIICSEFKKNMV